jgi:hypothetical protein
MKPLLEAHRINIEKMAMEHAQQIAENLDKLTIRHMPLSALKELKKLVDKEIKWRENLLKWYHIEDVDLVRKVEV